MQWISVITSSHCFYHSASQIVEKHQLIIVIIIIYNNQTRETSLIGDVCWFDVRSRSGPLLQVLTVEIAMILSV